MRDQVDIIWPVHERVHRYGKNRDDDQRSEQPDDSGYFVDIQHAGDKHQPQHDGGTNPWLPTELLLQVGASAGEHHETNGEQRDDYGDIQQDRHDWVRRTLEHQPVFTGVEIAAQLQENCSGKRHHDASYRSTCQPPHSIGREILHDLTAGGESRTDNEAHKGQGNTCNAFIGHRIIALSLLKKTVFG